MTTFSNSCTRVEAATATMPVATSARQNWGGRLEFLMSCISVSVGLGNIWRFPFTAYENGGGAFLIPYLAVLLLIGKPMYYLEVLLGQFTSQTSVRIWSVCPAFVGVGIGQAYAGIAVLTYYSSLLALTLYYLVVSCQRVLPWAHCRSEWGVGCVDALPAATVAAAAATVCTNATSATRRQSSSELYFLRSVIRETNDLSASGVGLPSWPLTLALFCAWLITYVVIVRGVRSTGKAAYFLALFPYIALCTLLVRAVTLEGAIDGIVYFLTPQWRALLEVRVWQEAVVQCFFSLAIGLGPIVMFSSYNRFEHNVHRDAAIVTALDTLTSLIAGITIFGILGNLAHNLGVSHIGDVVRSGTGLAFISYPDALAKFDAVPQLFAVLFFSMLFVLGIGTLVAQANTLVAMLCDQFVGWRASWVALGVVVIGFGGGIVYVTPGGQWLLNLVDYYGCTYVIFGLAVAQIIGISWLYGVQNFCDDIEFMTQRAVSCYWRTCWAIVTPVLLLCIFIYSLAGMQTLTYAGMAYPQAANIAGWLLLAIGFAPFPLWALWTCKHKWQHNLWQSLCNAVRPNAAWGPANVATKNAWLLHKAKLAEQRQRDKLKGNAKLHIYGQQLRNIFCSAKR